jgi:hypothetical protein
MIIYYEPTGIIKMEIEENKEILPCDIPYNLTDLYFGRIYNKQIKRGILPMTLVKIIFGEKYNQEICPNILPNNLQYLQFGRDFNKQININVLPVKLSHLIFAGTYNYLITYNTLPKNLVHLAFNFNKYEINEYVLPDTLTHLKLGYNYNYKIKKDVLPSNLVYLELGGIYSHILKDIPVTLTTVYICGSNENKIVIDNLPNTIVNLIFFNLEIEITNLPTSVKNIKLMCHSQLTLRYLNKIPFGCKIFDKLGKEIKLNR